MAPQSKPLLLKTALDAAAVWHVDQYRKYPNARVPYMSHLAGVVAILSRHGFSEEVTVAGALHDVIEDCGVTREELATRFGKRVADLVADVSEDDRSLPWEERKRAYLERFSHHSWDAQAITLADKIDNMQSIVVCAREHGDPWPMFKRGRNAQLARFAELLQRTAPLARHPLIDEFADALRTVTELSV